MIKVRYHLQHGPDYMKWQFKRAGEVLFYLEPAKNVVKLTNCVLHNNTKLAEKIYMGKNKDVCAWIRCKHYEVLPPDFHTCVKVSPYSSGELANISKTCTHLRYNPKVLPYWHTVSGKNIDGLAFDELYLTVEGVFYNPYRDDIHNPLK